MYVCMYVCMYDQSILESGLTEGWKNTANFAFRERTQQHKHKARS